MDRNFMFQLRQHLVLTNPDTRSERDQTKTEITVKKAYSEKLEKWGESAIRLFKIEHINYLTRRLVDLPETLESLDASQPWLAYWMVHSLKLLGYQLSDRLKIGIIDLMKSCQHPNGGFAGGPHQWAHLAPTYGAVNCLASLLSADALDVIDRQRLRDWLLLLRQPDGSFQMHRGGEVDVRGAYCAIATASITGLLRSHPEIFQGTAEWIARCQTYEGGFGGNPGLEAHGGYSFCAFAGLQLLGAVHLIDIHRLLYWAAHRQLPTEGGFQGRTHKLVDSCYSFWLGALFPLIDHVLQEDATAMRNDSELPLFETSALQEYIILCCQNIHHTPPGLSVPMPPNVPDTSGGGLVDKPGRNVDPYHTCYSLSGLSVAQHCPRRPDTQQSATSGDASVAQGEMPFIPAAAKDVAGSQWGNELADIDPALNVVLDAAVFARTYFARLDSGVDRSEAERKALEAAAAVAFKPTVCDESGDGDGRDITLAEVADDPLPNICTSP